MFCYQCEQTAKGTGCDKFGVCGKSPEVSDLQDLLVYAVKGIAMYAHRAGRLGLRDREVDVFILEALFSTVTNVDFDPDRLEDLIRKAAEIKDKARALYEEACKQAGKTPENLTGPAGWVPALQQPPSAPSVSHVAEQPSPSVVLPSSQVSSLSMFELPQVPPADFATMHTSSRFQPPSSRPRSLVNENLSFTLPLAAYAARSTSWNRHSRSVWLTSPVSGMPGVVKFCHAT